MRKYAILTYTSKGMMFGGAPDDASPARLNEGLVNSSRKAADGTVMDLIRDENGTIIKFVSQVEALNYCAEKGWALEQTIFNPHDGFNSRDPLSSYIFILSKE